MMRVAAFKQVGGFNPSFIAGEEPELCVRLREKGWKIHRLDADIATHDADMHCFGQWWRRAVRNGYSIAEGARTHGHRPERYWVREARRGWVWGLVLPVVALAAAWPTRGWSVVAAVCLYALLFMKVGSALRTALSRPGESVCSADPTPLGTRLTYALFIVLGKIPQALGQLRYWFGGSP